MFSIELEPCKTEVDITIVDRICALLNPQPICVCNPVSKNKDIVSFATLLHNFSVQYNLNYYLLLYIFQNQQTLFYQVVESPALSNFAAVINVSSSQCTIKLR